jgi:hypothetical protein
MRKADYTLLAAHIRARLKPLIARCVHDDVVWMDESYSRACELILLAETFAKSASVDAVAFLDACGIPDARTRLRIRD